MDLIIPIVVKSKKMQLFYSLKITLLVCLVTFLLTHNYRNFKVIIKCSVKICCMIKYYRFTRSSVL